MGDLKDDLNAFAKAAQDLQDAVDAEDAAEKDHDKKLKAAAKANNAIDLDSPKVQQQLKAAEDAESAAVESWRDLQAAKRATRRARQRAAKALAKLYNDVFAIGPL